MKHLIHPDKQKFVIVLVAALVSMFGFQAASSAIEVYQIGKFLEIAFYVYLFLVFWQTFIFDLHLKKAGSWQQIEKSLWQALKARFEYLRDIRHWLHFQNYLILPGFIYWTTIVLIYLNPFETAIKQVWIFMSTIALTKTFWYLKTIFYAHDNASRVSRQLLFLAKLYASYLAFAATLGIMHYFGYGGELSGLLTFLITFLLMYQALFQHHFVSFDILRLLCYTGLVMGVAGYLVYFFWNVNYYSGALILTGIYNTMWGLVHHKYIEKNLTVEMVYEYLAVLFVILVIVFSTTNFAARI